MRIRYNLCSRVCSNQKIDTIGYYKYILKVGLVEKISLFDNEFSNNNPFLKQLNLKPYDN